MKQIITLLAILLTLNNFSQTPAFPSAYGGGAYATGGRGGNVYRVTNLLDDGSVGSFRWAIAQPRPATIVFDVSGTIECTNYIIIEGKDLTIAGQTAPVGGITFTFPNPNHNFSFSGRTGYNEGVENMIIRYIRIRYQRDNNKTGLDLYGNTGVAKNLIFDHVSISYAGWTGIALRGVGSHNNTIQNCIIAECKTGAIFGDSDTNFDSVSYDNSFNNNFFYNTSHRFPNPNSIGRVDVINNVIQNYTFRQNSNTHTPKLNHINNYTAAGIHTSLSFQSMNRAFEGHPVYNNGINNEIYTSGNIIDNGIFTNPNGDNKLLWSKWNAGSETQYLGASEFVNTMHPLIGRPFAIKTATQAYNDVINNQTVGASRSLNADGTCVDSKDANDSAYLAITAQGQGVYEAYTTGNAGTDRSFFYEQRYFNFLASVSSTPLNTRPAGYDTDNDGMADLWETNTFGDLSRDGTLDFDNDGYTDLEEYLNGVDNCGVTVDPCTGKNAPVATMVSSGTNLSKSDTMNLSVNYTSDTTLTSVVYYLNNNILSTTTTPFVFDTIGLGQGTYTSYGVLTDACGNTSNTDTVNITIKGLEVDACSTSTPPIIDGIADVIWTSIPFQNLEVTQNGLTFPDTNDLKVNYKVMWDANSLYLFVKVKDDTLVSDSPQIDFHKDDAVCIFIDGLDEDNTSYDANDFYMGFKQGTADMIINNMLYTGSGVSKTDILTANGYNMEIKIDWSYIGIAPNVNNTIGLDFRVDDDDDGAWRENHVLWNDETSTLWNDPSKFGVLKLSNTSCANTTSIKIVVEDDLKVYPNPTNGELTISSSNLINKIEVYNTLGALVLSKDKLSSKSKELNIANLTKGVYSIKIYESNRVVEKQIIKQ